MELHKQLENLYLFRLVASIGSFQGAADKVQLPRSSVSKRISQLEQQLNVRLLERSTRKLALTQSGSQLLKSTEKLQEVLSQTEQLSEQQRLTPSGKVKISCSTLMAERYLLAKLHDISKQFPDIRFELNLTDDIVDLIDNQIDIAIRIGHLPDSSLLAKKIGEKFFAWFASPEYLAVAGTPDSPDALLSHRCLVFKNKGTTMDKWPFVHQNGQVFNIKPHAVTYCDDARAMVQLAVLGQGVVMGDPYYVQQELNQGQLVPILTEYAHPDRQPIHLVCLGKQGRSKAVQCVWEALSHSLNRM
ncbi:LysR family transcriptional regulator [Pseudoalteromonas sp. CO348]|uniref:LysR family transcriptional regulator n=1 Tax=Pseudoalteromonas sp. CO348 TaxID=1777271 RepID=UPI001023E19A|nr:LysR family transcriptional regulator [Pseudoalteromonas sp. CO348]RZG04414.1 LysR family transcriptional regulator [Pseudoalteromonas sp. CO348]